jgi:hypothetical protein
MSAISAIFQRLDLYRTFPAIILSLVIQACTASAPVRTPIGPGSAPPMSPPFDAYADCIHSPSRLLFGAMAASQEDCFKQAIQANHLTLPAGTTTDQAFAKYKDCAKNGPLSVSVGDRAVIGGKEQNAFRQNCFTSALH